MESSLLIYINLNSKISVCLIWQNDVFYGVIYKFLRQIYLVQNKYRREMTSNCYTTCFPGSWYFARKTKQTNIYFGHCCFTFVYVLGIYRPSWTQNADHYSLLLWNELKFDQNVQLSTHGFKLQIVF
jgi:hypothetical protein